MDRKIVISRLWKKRGIQQYFSLLQFSKEFWDFEIDAHILIDDWVFRDDWTNEIESLNTPHRPNFPMNITFYSINELKDWYVQNNILSPNDFNHLRSFIHINHLLLYYYLYVEKGIDYVVSYDDDVVFNKKVSEELEEVDGLVLNKIPFIVDEDYYPISDKGMMYKLSQHFGRDLSIDYYRNNPKGIGSNAGFMGIELNTVFAPFKDNFRKLFNMFDLVSPSDKSIDEPYHYSDKLIFDTQEQSYLSIMLHCFSTKPLFRLSNNLGYFFDTPIQEAVNKSKLIHFTGDRKYDPIFPKTIIEFLKKNGHNHITTDWFYY
jgi:hypothetical protein